MPLLAVTSGPVRVLFAPPPKDPDAQCKPAYVITRPKTVTSACALLGAAGWPGLALMPTWPPLHPRFAQVCGTLAEPVTKGPRCDRNHALWAVARSHYGQARSRS